MSRKIMCLFLVLVLILTGMMSGCGEEEETEPESTTMPIPTEEPASFSISNLSIEPIKVPCDENTTITVTVSNTGDIEGSYKLILKINGVNEAEKNVTVAGHNEQNVSFNVAKGKTGRYEVMVDGLSGRFTVLNALPLQIIAWEGVTAKKVCLTVEQLYVMDNYEDVLLERTNKQELALKYSHMPRQPITEAIQSILRRIGVQVTTESEPCDAILKFEVTFSPLSCFYHGAGSLYTGATAGARLEMAVEGRIPVQLSGYGKSSCPTVIPSTHRPEKPEEAPFGRAWQRPLLQCLSELWGPQILIEALGEYEMSLVARTLLVEMKGEAVDILIRALKDEDEDVRCRAAKALGQIGDARAVEPLIQALELEDETSNFCGYAEEALEKIRGE